MWVDQSAKLMNYLNNDFRISKIPPNYFSKLSKEDKQLLIEFVGKQNYEIPGFCSMTGFEINEENLKPLFKKYTKHIDEL